MTSGSILPPRSPLYLPASNARAIEKARGLAADLLMLDLEDAVRPESKESARSAAVDAVETGFDGRLSAIRINGAGTIWHDEDVIAVSVSHADFVVVPKVEDSDGTKLLGEALGKPLLVMIETPKGVLNAAQIASAKGVAGVIVGTNDLANELRIPAAAGRGGLAVALQTIILAARAAGVWVFDGVFNDLNNAAGLEAECTEGRGMGFDGKTLIHPNQIDIANRIWSPTETEVEEARALIAAASGGAERFRDRMIETMHVEMAHRLLLRSNPG